MTVSVFPHLLTLGVAIIVLAACQRPTAPDKAGGGAADVPLADLPAVAVIVADGNSMTDPVFNGGNDWPGVLAAEMGVQYRWFNVAVASRATPEMITLAPTNVDPRLRILSVSHVVVAWEGINDISLGATGPQAFDNFVTYGQARRVKGWRVVALPILPNPDGSAGPAELAERDAFNALLRASWQSCADLFVDLVADPKLGSLAPADRALYYQPDKLHLTAAGQARVAFVMRPAIERMLGLRV